MWTAIWAGIKAFAMLLGMKERAEAENVGQTKQENTTLKETAKVKEEMDAARAAGPRTADDVDDRLRKGNL